MPRVYGLDSTLFERWTDMFRTFAMAREVTAKGYKMVRAEEKEIIVNM